ncbi:hypothetical protein DF043_36880 [Burkholderia cepacia]|nr:hypothetical protein DF043_36880 [Burkholderia cepacia]
MNTQRVYAADEQAFELLSRLSIDERLDLILAAFDHEQGAADRLMEALRAYVPANELVNS